jgi:hypothetical protein
MATVIPVQSTWGLITIGLGYLIFGSMLTALFFFLDFMDADKDVNYSHDHAQYWLGFPVCIGVFLYYLTEQSLLLLIKIYIYMHN